MPVRRRPDAGSQAEGRRAGSIERVVSGRIWSRGKFQPVDIGIDAEGRIARVGRDVPGGPRLDFGERVLVPSAVDLHVHFREPGPEGSAEEFATGSIQAALGGVGLVGEMPNTSPPVTTRDRLREKAARARGRLAVDALLYAWAVDPVQIDSVRHVAGGYKLYLSPTSSVEEAPGPSDLPPLLTAVARTGLPLAVHAEDPHRFRSTGDPRDPVEWNGYRPAAAEESAVASLLPAPPALRLHVAHVSTPQAARTLRRAGHSFESTPQHLLLHDRSGSDARFKVNPPLRSKQEQTELYEAFCAGEVPCLASDHAPHSTEAKERGFSLAPSGMPGVETMLPLLLARVRDGELALPTLVAAAAERPALWLGIPQGRIAPGFRANLCVVDFRSRRRLRPEELHAPAGWTAFEGFEATFPTDHFLDGQRIVEDGEYVGSPRGRVLRPEYAEPRLLA